MTSGRVQVVRKAKRTLWIWKTSQKKVIERKNKKDLPETNGQM